MTKQASPVLLTRMLAAPCCASRLNTIEHLETLRSRTTPACIVNQDVDSAVLRQQIGHQLVVNFVVSQVGGARKQYLFRPQAVSACRPSGGSCVLLSAAAPFWRPEPTVLPPWRMAAPIPRSPPAREGSSSSSLGSAACTADGIQTGF